jgi:hypothetical protein
MSISITGLDKILKKLGHFETMRIMEEPMERSLLKIESAMSEYPPPPAPGEWAAKTTVRQKRAFFALLRAGQIKGKRTGTLGRRWTHAITKSAGGMEGVVGNNTEYGPWVQSKRFQARFHQGRWQTDEEVLENLHGEIKKDFEDTVKSALD